MSIIDPLDRLPAVVAGDTSDGGLSSSTSTLLNLGTALSDDEDLPTTTVAVTPREPRRPNFKRSNSMALETRDKTRKLSKNEVCNWSVFDPQSGYFDTHTSLKCDSGVKLMSCGEFDLCLARHFSTPLPPVNIMFPWLHGIHRNNYAQLQFLGRGQPEDEVNIDGPDTLVSPRLPKGVRNLMVVRSCNTQGDVSSAYSDIITESTGMIRGTVSADDILLSSQAVSDLEDYLLTVLGDVIDGFPLDELVVDCQVTGLVPVFNDMDPQFGVSLRNFHIQVSKMGNLSDFVVYCFNDDHRDEIDGGSGGACKCSSLARLLHIAQLLYARENPEIDGLYHTYVLEDPSTKQLDQANLLAIPVLDTQSSIKQADDLCSAYDLNVFNNWDSNYLYRERLEISRMSTATPVGHVWLGNITDYECLQIRLSNGDLLPKDQYTLPKVPLHCDGTNTIVTLTSNDLHTENRTAKELDSKLITFPKTRWHLFIHCYEGALFPSIKQLKSVFTMRNSMEQISLAFPPSGSLTLSDMSEQDILTLVNVCKLCYIHCTAATPGLLYCSDGYTETSMLAICYLMYSEQLHVDDALIKLHIGYGRPFFIFKTDYVLLEKLEPVLHHFSPLNFTRTSDMFNMEEDLDNIKASILMPTRRRRSRQVGDDSCSFTTATGHHEVQLRGAAHLLPAEGECGIPAPMAGADDTSYLSEVMGSLPSRILPHLYLGSLGHASCISLLSHLGIEYIVSVGERIPWLDMEYDSITTPSGCEILTMRPGQIYSGSGEKCHVKQVMQIYDISDDGIGTLTTTINDALDFIDDCYKNSGKVLVHCQVGVSRSATVCIAEVMRRLNVSLPRAYMFVRVRRLNVIIQPNLKLMYELFKWEEQFVRSKKADLTKTTFVKRRSNASHSSTGSASSGASSLFSRYSARVPSIGQISEDNEAVQSDSDEDRLWGTKPIISNTPGFLREVDWSVLCREIFNLNRAYIKPTY